MKKNIRAIFIVLFPALAAVGVLQWKSTIITIAFQVGGSHNTIEQRIQPRNQSLSVETPSSRLTPQVTEREAPPSNTQIEQPREKIGKQLKPHKTKVKVEEEADCYYDEEDDTDSEEEYEVEDPAGV